MLKLTSKESNALLPEGRHIVSVKSMVSETAKASEFYTDVTPQLKITFVDAAGKQFSNWYNLVGFKRFVATKDGQDALTDAEVKSGKYESAGPEGYAIHKTGPNKGKRVRSTENTEQALDKLNRLGYACGVEAGAEFDVDDLIGQTCGIEIKNDGQKNKVNSAFKPTEAQVAEYNEAVAS